MSFSTFAPLTLFRLSRADSPPLTDVNLNDEELEEALSQRSSATKQLLQRLQALHPSSDTEQSSKVEELETRCRDLLDQVSSISSQKVVQARLTQEGIASSQSNRSREALRVVRLTHEQTLTELESTHAALLRAEKRFDRYQSATVAAIEGRTLSGPRSPTNGSATDAGGESGAKSPTTTADRSAKGKGPSHATDDDSKRDGSAAQQQAAAEAVANAMGGELEELRDLVVRRAQELEELRNERVSLKREIDALKVKVRILARESSPSVPS